MENNGHHAVWPMPREQEANHNKVQIHSHLTQELYTWQAWYVLGTSQGKECNISRLPWLSEETRPWKPGNKPNPPYPQLTISVGSSWSQEKTKEHSLPSKTLVVAILHFKRAETRERGVSGERKKDEEMQQLWRWSCLSAITYPIYR